MAEEHAPAKAEKKPAEPAPAAAAAKKDEPAPKPSSPAFSKKGYMILGAVVVLEAAVFFFMKGGKREAQAEHTGEEAHAATHEEDLANYFKVGRAVLELGEIKVPITSTQPRAPRSISASFQVVITHELGEKLSGGGGGHGGGGKGTPQGKVLELNVRSILREMMDAEGVRLLEPSAKADFRRKAKDRLNHVQVDGDEEEAQVLKILRGQVLQVIMDKFETQAY